MRKTVALEPTITDLRTSYKSKDNTRLAHALWPLLSFGTYDRMSAHRWALKLIQSDPINGRDIVACLVNFDYMIEGALQRYDTDTHYQARHDKAYAAYAQWLNAS